MSHEADPEHERSPTRRSWLSAAALGAGTALWPGAAGPSRAELAGALPPDSTGAGIQIPSERNTQDKFQELPSLDDFGPVGDGKTDDAEQLQSAFDWAALRPGTRLRVPPRMYGLRRPILMPENLELHGELPGAGNVPLCGFRALPGFTSPYTLQYRSGRGLTETVVAALLISKEWTENAAFNRRLHLRDLFFDVNALTETRGGPIHGLMLANQQIDLHNVWIRSATGFGVWINTQRPDGAFMRAIVDNVLRRVWVRGAGVGDATFQTDAGTFRYGGFLIGALPGAKDPSGAGEPPLATDGILDYCTVAVGPEANIGCRGNGIHITHSAGWRLTGCHLNGAGRHGIVLGKAFQTELSGGYLDGWGVAVGGNEGTFGCIWCDSMVSLGSESDGGLVIAANRLRARAVGSTIGNRFVALSLHAGGTPTPRATVLGNVVVKRRDATHPFAIYDFGRGGAGKLEAAVLGNIASGAASTFLQPWNESAVRPYFTGNSFQHTTAPPAAGWHPTGIRIQNTAPTPGGWDGWVSVRAGEPGTWRGFGAIET
jgi:hypothetical protein